MTEGEKDGDCVHVNTLTDRELADYLSAQSVTPSRLSFRLVKASVLPSETSNPSSFTQVEIQMST